LNLKDFSCNYRLLAKESIKINKNR
jgi:hypothetical protein